MKKTLKAFAVTAAFLAAGACAFAETSVNAYNKLSSDLVKIDMTEDGTTTSFPGVKNRIYAEVLSDRVDAMVKGDLIFSIEDAVNSDLKEYNYLKMDLELADWYVEVRPIDMLTIGLHDGITTPGSYLPVYDDNLSSGNMGSDFSLCLRPIKGLRIAGSLDLEADFGKEGSTPAFNFGADYVLDDIGSFGVIVRDVAATEDDKWDGTLGVYAGLSCLKDVGFDFVNVGFALNAAADTGVGGNLLSIGYSYSNKSFNLSGDFVTNFEAKDIDVYLALCPNYKINSNFRTGLSFAVVGSYVENSAAILDFYPYVDYVNGSHKIETGVRFNVNTSGETVISFPTYWKYTF